MTYLPLDSERAVDLYSRLVAARSVYLQPALSDAVRVVGVAQIDSELNTLVPQDSLTRLASLGIRGERVFPTPSILTEAPTLIAYYRMLLGISQKGFAQTYKYGRFLTAEAKGSWSSSTAAELPQLCEVFRDALVILVDELPDFTDQDLHELTLLSLGMTFQGSRNVRIGQTATLGVFQTIAFLLDDHIVDRSDTHLTIVNAAGRRVQTTFGSDPDVILTEDVGGSSEPLIAIEIKGGLDRSNAHNRAGEAEKSHLKAKQEGFNHRWTIISLTGIDERVVRGESPSTTRIFDVTEVLGRSGPTFDEFKRQLTVLLGLPEPN